MDYQRSGLAILNNEPSKIIVMFVKLLLVWLLYLVLVTVIFSVNNVALQFVPHVPQIKNSYQKTEKKNLEFVTYVIPSSII